MIGSSGMLRQKDMLLVVEFNAKTMINLKSESRSTLCWLSDPKNKKMVRKVKAV